jgi:hypothetical protein
MTAKASRFRDDERFASGSTEPLHPAGAGLKVRRATRFPEATNDGSKRPTRRQLLIS